MRWCFHPCSHQEPSEIPLPVLARDCMRPKFLLAYVGVSSSILDADHRYFVRLFTTRTISTVVEYSLFLYVSHLTL
jgi:hypothetical protein